MFLSFLVELKSLGDSPPEPRPVDQFEGRFLAREELQGLAADIIHDLFGLGFGEAPSADLHQGQIHQKPEVSKAAILFTQLLPMFFSYFRISQGSFLSDPILSGCPELVKGKARLLWIWGVWREQLLTWWAKDLS